MPALLCGGFPVPLQASRKPHSGNSASPRTGMVVVDTGSKGRWISNEQSPFAYESGLERQIDAAASVVTNESGVGPRQSIGGPAVVAATP